MVLRGWPPSVRPRRDLRPAQDGRPAAEARHRGVARVGWMFTFGLAVYNLVRIRNLAYRRAREVVPNLCLTHAHS